MPIADPQPASATEQGSGTGIPTSLSFKVVLLGDASVGKTSLAMRFSRDEFATSYKQTIGVDFFIRRIKLPGGITVTVQLWDIGGSTISNTMASNYVTGCQAALLIYDVTQYQSFVNLEEWLGLVHKVCGGALPYLVLVANKVDLVHLKAVKNGWHQELTAKHNLYSYVVSAKTGESISATLYRVASDLAGVPLTDQEIQELIAQDASINTPPTNGPSNPSSPRDVLAEMDTPARHSGACLPSCSCCRCRRTCSCRCKPCGCCTVQ